MIDDERILNIKKRIRELEDTLKGFERENELEQEKKANESCSQELVGEAEQTEDDTGQEAGELRQIHRSKVKRKLAQLRRKKKRY